MEAEAAVPPTLVVASFAFSIGEDFREVKKRDIVPEI